MSVTAHEAWPLIRMQVAFGYRNQATLKRFFAVRRCSIGVYYVCSIPITCEIGASWVRISQESGISESCCSRVFGIVRNRRRCHGAGLFGDSPRSGSCNGPEQGFCGEPYHDPERGRCDGRLTLRYASPNTFFANHNRSTYAHPIGHGRRCALKGVALGASVQKRCGAG